MYLAVRRGDLFVALSHGGVGAFVLMILCFTAFALEYCIRRKRGSGRRIPRLYWAMTVLVGLVYLFYGAREWSGGSVWSYLGELAHSVWSAFSPDPNCQPAMHYVASVLSVVVVGVLISEFVRRTLRTRETVSVLEERSRLALEGYERMLRSEEATNAVRHEMRHHMTALRGILQTGDTERAEEYVAAVTSEMERLPAGRYSPNMLVNVIAGAYLDQAKAEGVQVECGMNVPPQLAIADEDLSVFLSNMLENAVQACRRMDPSRERFIRVKLHLHENSLFIGCTNSTSDEQGTEARGDTAREHRQHGYGMEAMRRVAEKYDSILIVDRSPGVFAVKSNLNLKAQG